MGELHCIPMNYASSSTMHFEMSYEQKKQKPLWNGLFCIGTHGAVTPAGRDSAEASNSNETGNTNEDAAPVCNKSTRQTPRHLQAASVPVPLCALQVVVRRQRRAPRCT